MSEVDDAHLAQAANWPTVSAPPETQVAAPRPRPWRGALVTAFLLAAIWAGLHWDDPESWMIGGPAALLGGAATLLLPVPEHPRVSPLGGMRLASFAAVGVLRGAWDVSLRSLQPGKLSPGMLSYVTRLPEGAPRRLFALSITMLPGTLTTELAGDVLAIHALDRSAATWKELRTLEDKVAAVYGLTLAAAA